MTSENKLILVFNSAGIMLNWNTEGNVITYISFEKLVGCNINDIFPENAAVLLLDAIGICHKTRTLQTCFYHIGNQKYIAKISEALIMTEESEEVIVVSISATD